MSTTPTADELIEQLAIGGRVSLDEVKLHPSGFSPIDDPPVVQPKEAGWTGRFDLSNADMLRDLAMEVDELFDDSGHGADASVFKLINIRVQHMNNSTLNTAHTNRGRFYNPALLHPADMHQLDLRAGDTVTIKSDLVTLQGVVEPDADLRRGVVAMSFAFGGLPKTDGAFREIGTPVNRLLNSSDLADRYVGMPRMGNVSVRVSRGDGS
jgi:anaerobic selenocysteine-containing dehydrogenase